jgi:hypothetical protein
MGNCSGSTKNYMKQIARTEEFKTLISNLYEDIVKEEEDTTNRKKHKNIQRIQKRFEKSKYLNDLLK